MAKKRKDNTGTAPRKPMQFPLDWFNLAKTLAGSRKQPAVWMLLELLGEEAERQGKDRPRYPWEPE